MQARSAATSRMPRRMLASISLRWRVESATQHCELQLSWCFKSTQPSQLLSSPNQRDCSSLCHRRVAVGLPVKSVVFRIKSKTVQAPVSYTLQQQRHDLKRGLPSSVRSNNSVTSALTSAQHTCKRQYACHGQASPRSGVLTDRCELNSKPCRHAPLPPLLITSAVCYLCQKKKKEKLSSLQAHGK
jgi:hypothetical protein